MADHFTGLEERFTAAVNFYNNAVGSLDSRDLFNNRKFRVVAAGSRGARNLQPPQTGTAPRQLHLPDYNDAANPNEKPADAAAKPNPPPAELLTLEAVVRSA